MDYYSSDFDVSLPLPGLFLQTLRSEDYVMLLSEYSDYDDRVAGW